MERLYTAKATCVGGRSGTVKTDDGVLSLTMCMPDEHSKFKSEKCTNPEQLFACAYSVCFLSALNYILKKERLPYEDTKVDIYVQALDIIFPVLYLQLLLSKLYHQYMLKYQVNKLKKLMVLPIRMFFYRRYIYQMT